jgi:hypothetical protein
MQRPTGIIFAVGVWILFVAASSGCGQPAPPPFKGLVDVKGLMNGVIDPSADVVWESVAITIDKDGEVDKQPRTEEEWTTVRNHALTLAEAGNLLMIYPRVKDNDQWMKMSRALIDISNEAFLAAQAKDPNKLLYLGGSIDDACEACHKKYMPGY